MGTNKVGNQVKSNAPPYSPKYAARGALQPAQDADRVVYFGQVLEDEHGQEHRHHRRRRSSSN